MVDMVAEMVDSAGVDSVETPDHWARVVDIHLVHLEERWEVVALEQG